MASLIDGLSSLHSRPACYRAAVQENIRERTLQGATLVEAVRALRANLSELERYYKTWGGEAELVIVNGLTNALLRIQEGL